MLIFKPARPNINSDQMYEALGFIPDFLSELDERPAKEQINENYAHGGGWLPLTGWSFDPDTLIMQYPEDPPYKPIAMAKLREERIILYPYSWVAIVQPDNTFEMARLD